MTRNKVLTNAGLKVLIYLSEFVWISELSDKIHYLALARLYKSDLTHIGYYIAWAADIIAHDNHNAFLPAVL